MAETETAPMEEDALPPLLRPHTLPLLQLIKAEQQANGIASGDFGRYRKHCGNKLKALFKLLKFQHGRTKYQKRKVEAAHAAGDARFLHIVLFNAERAWAYAMQLKKENEADLSKPRRNHLIRRLRKAKVWAEDLVRVAAQVCDARSQLEAEAYASWMLGHLLLEQETDWAAALAKFTRATMLFEGLAKVVPLDQQTLCLQMVEDTKPSIRFCAYQMDRKREAAPNEAQLLVMSDPKGQAGLNEIKSQLGQLAQEAQEHQVVSTMFLEWQGRSIPVKAERVRASLQQANEYASKLAEASASASSSRPGTAGPDAMQEDPSCSAASGSEPLLALYTRMINAYNEAKSHVRNALKASSAAEGDLQYQELVSLEMAVHGTVLERAIDRSRLLVREAEERFAAGMERVALGKRAREKDKYAKAEDVVRLLEALARGLGELAELGARLGGRQGEELHDRCGVSLAQVQASRVYYVAQSLLTSDKPLEAFAMFGRAAERVAEARQRLAELPKSAGVGGQGRGGRVGPDIRPDLCLSGGGARRARGAGAAQPGGVAAGRGRHVAGRDRRRGSGGPTAAQGFLVDQLDVWESFVGQPGAKAPRICRVPFAMQPIPMRPIMLDTASSFIEYPALDHRYKKQEKKGVLSSLFGWGAKK